VKERPILFSAPMVRALLAGRKTQTRRLIKPQPMKLSGERYIYSDKRQGDLYYVGESHFRKGMAHDFSRWNIGDRLWVREQIMLPPKEITGHMLCEGADTWLRCVYFADGAWFGNIEDLATPVAVKHSAESERLLLRKLNWRSVPSIFVPRWASRITLEVTGVRVEQLQEISESDAQAEGVDPIVAKVPTHRDAYRYLWDEINGVGSWNANPWVWVIEFKRVMRRQP